MAEPLLEITNSPEWVALKDSPVLLPYLKQTVESHKQEWAEWGYDAEDVAHAAKLNAKALGIVGWVITFIAALENVQLNPKEEKPNG